MNQIEKIYRNSLKEIKYIFPIFFAAVLLSALIELYIPNQIIYAVLGKNLLLSIPLATISGVILPIPRYATYPIAYTLYMKGATIGVIFSLISGEVIVGALDRDIMEFKFFGSKSYVLRMILCIIFVILGGFLIEVFL
jgi:hypothetical protein